MEQHTNRLFEPAVLRWARTQANWSEEALASKLETFWKDITPQVIRSWETGAEAPTPAHVRKLAELYKRPVAVFLLVVPPDEKALPPDRRTIGSHVSRAFSSAALLQ